MHRFKKLILEAHFQWQVPALRLSADTPIFWNAELNLFAELSLHLFSKASNIA